MDGVLFEEDPQIVKADTSTSLKRKSSLVNLVVSCGLAKTNKGAESVLLIIIVLGFAVTIFFVLNPLHASVPQSVFDANNAKLLRNASAQ